MPIAVLAFMVTQPGKTLFSAATSSAQPNRTTPPINMTTNAHIGASDGVREV
jgi:hypothetical protein